MRVVHTYRSPVNVRGQAIAAGRATHRARSGDRISPEEVVRLLRDVRRALRLASENADLQPAPQLVPYLPLFGVLAKRPGVTISELGRIARMPKSQVSVVMARAETQGLVSKEPDAADARLIRLRITPSGKAQLSRWRAAHHRVLWRALSSLSPDEVGAVITSLNALLRALQREEPPLC